MNLRNLVCCPRCKGELRDCSEETRVAQQAPCAPAYACAGCRVEYLDVYGVVDFLPDRNEAPKFGKRLMEADWMVDIYEGRLWRASRLSGWMTGISLEDEMLLIDRILDLGPSDSVLDLACGPGLYARRFAEEGPDRDVVGLDLSWPMLRWGIRKARGQRIGNIAFVHGDAQQIPLRDASLDAANCCGALHLFPDVRRVLGELRRVIKPGGRFSTAVIRIVDWDLLPGLRRAYDEKIGLHRFKRGELEELLDEAGFTDEDGDGIRSKNNIPLELRIVSPTWGSNPEVIQLIRADWETIGARVILEVAPGFGPLKEAQTQGEYHAIGINFFGTDPDLLRSFFSSKGLYNWTGFTDPEQDQLLLQAAQTSLDPEERLRLYQQFVSDVQEEALLLPIRFYVNLVVASKHIEGLHFSAQGWYPILIDLRITH